MATKLIERAHAIDDAAARAMGTTENVETVTDAVETEKVKASKPCH